MATENIRLIICTKSPNKVPTTVVTIANGNNGIEFISYKFPMAFLKLSFIPPILGAIKL